MHLIPRRMPRSGPEATDAPRGRDVRGRDRAAPACRPRVWDTLGEIHGRRTARPAGYGTDHRSFGPPTSGRVDDDERLDARETRGGPPGRGPETREHLDRFARSRGIPRYPQRRASAGPPRDPGGD